MGSSYLESSNLHPAIRNNKLRLLPFNRYAKGHLKGDASRKVLGFKVFGSRHDAGRSKGKRV
jgi:hypothetical protein